jgi:hypothetical protein
MRWMSHVANAAENAAENAAMQQKMQWKMQQCSRKCSDAAEQTSCHILPHLTTSHHISPHLATSCHILPHLATSCHILPHLTTSHHISPHLTTSCHISPHLTTNLFCHIFFTTFGCVLRHRDNSPALSSTCSLLENATAAFEIRMWMHIVVCLAFGLSLSNPEIMTRLSPFLKDDTVVTCGKLLLNAACPNTALCSAIRLIFGSICFNCP